MYNSLIGVGIKWGLHSPDPVDFEGTNGNTTPSEVPDDWPWQPDALLRAPWHGCERFEMECVGNVYKILEAAEAAGGEV